MKGMKDMAFSLHGVKLPHIKNTDNMSAVKMNAPKEVKIPMLMHIGKPAIPVVEVGDEVKIGDIIAQQDGFISSPIYASVSGKVTKIDDVLLSRGTKTKSITIESDGLMAVSENITPPSINSREELIEAIKNSGIVGLGGAGFPTYVKFNVDKPEEIEHLIINGAECEPYITSDSVTMCERAEDIKAAIEYIKKYCLIKNVVIGIEKNKPNAIKAMQKLTEGDPDIKVVILPEVYPQGGEKVLIYHTTGKVVKAGKLPKDVGCIVCNSTTMASIGRYIKTGMPLVEKCITVDGGAVKEPKNVIVPIGTSLQDVFEFCGGFKSEPVKVIYGGPMMGIAVPDLNVPVIKNTNAILAFDKKQAKEPKTIACISCGACVNHCPFGINPAQIAKAFKNNDLEKVEELGVGLCMECGCCSYICPSNRPLVQNNKLAKMALAEAKEANK